MLVADGSSIEGCDVAFGRHRWSVARMLSSDGGSSVQVRAEQLWARDRLGFDELGKRQIADFVLGLNARGLRGRQSFWAVSNRPMGLRRLLELLRTDRHLSDASRGGGRWDIETARHSRQIGSRQGIQHAVRADVSAIVAYRIGMGCSTAQLSSVYSSGVTPSTRPACERPMKPSSQGFRRGMCPLPPGLSVYQTSGDCHSEERNEEINDQQDIGNGI